MAVVCACVPASKSKSQGKATWLSLDSHAAACIVSCKVVHLAVQVSIPLLSAFRIIADLVPMCMQPLKCLCGSVKCRGFIGGKEVANRADDPR